MPETALKNSSYPIIQFLGVFTITPFAFNVNPVNGCLAPLIIIVNGSLLDSFSVTSSSFSFTNHYIL